MAGTNETPKYTDSSAWIKGLSSVMQLNSKHETAQHITTVSSDIQDNKISFFLPPDMPELQADNLRYLQAIAQRNNAKLVEDRRSSDIRPLLEQRDLNPHKLSTSIAQLLKQAGMPGEKPTLSSPHRLRAGIEPIEITTLIKMVSASVTDSKRIALLPTRSMVESTGNETHPISAHACKLITKDRKVVLSYFDSPSFKAIGYVANSQFVVHVFIGGGPIRSPQLWVKQEALAKNRFKCQLFRSKQPGQDFGLMYNTFYLDINTVADSDLGKERRDRAL